MRLSRVGFCAHQRADVMDENAKPFLIIKVVERTLMDRDGSSVTAKFTTNGCLLVSSYASVEKQLAAIHLALSRPHLQPRRRLASRLMYFSN